MGTRKLIILSFLLYFIASANELVSEETQDVERDKYIRNAKFNDSYMDIFFKTSPGSLPSSWMFCDENFVYRQNALMELIPISRTRLTHKPNFSFEGIPMYNIFSGATDLSQYYMLSNFFFLENVKSDSSRLPITSDMMNFKSDTNLRKRNTNFNIGAGSQVGSILGHLFTHHRQFKYFVSGGYVNSAGVPVPDEAPERLRTNLGTLKNSGFDAGLLFGKIYFDNNSSQVGINVFFSSGSKSIPPSMLWDSIVYMNLPKRNDMFVNLEFSTQLESFLELSGNVFYKNFYTKLSYFDDSTYTSQRLESSMNKIFYGYNYGALISAKSKLFDLLPESSISFTYIRDIVNRREKDSSPTNRYECENLEIAFRQPILLEKFKFFPTLKYSIKKPLFSDIAPINSIQKAIDCRLDANYEFNTNFKYFATLSCESKLPAMQELFFQSPYLSHSIKAEKENNVLSGIIAHYPDLEIKFGLYYSQLRDIITATTDSAQPYFFNQGEALCYGADFNLTLFANYGYILLNYTYSEINKKLDFFAKPKHIGEIKIYNSYSIGFRWQVEAEYFSNEYYLSSNINNISTKHLFMLNFRLGINVFDRNELFIGGYNLLNSYYETQYGLPGPGFSFFMGVHIYM